MSIERIDPQRNFGLKVHGYYPYYENAVLIAIFA
jgi:hypothetical protein